MNKSIPLIILIVFCFANSFAQTTGWAKKMGGTSADEGHGVVTDDSGNVYTTGYFNGTVDFDPGTGIYNLTSTGQNDIFISKLNAAGNFVWAKRIGNTDSDYGQSIAADDSGNVYVTGYFGGIVDFNPDSGVAFTLMASGGTDIFILKLKATGNFVWVKRIGDKNYDYGFDITIDSSKNIYVTGSFADTVDFDPGAGTNTLIAKGQQDIFILKLDTAGNFVWAKSIGNTGNDFGMSVTTDNWGNVFATGAFEGTTDFNPGAATNNLTSAGAADIFVLKLDAAGNYVWAKNMGGSSNDEGHGIAVDDSANVYVTGRFPATADFDPGTAIYNITPAGGFDIFILKLNAPGNLVWAKGFGAGSNDWGNDIVLDDSANVYSTGLFRATVDFDPGSGTYYLTSSGSTAADIFIFKLRSSGSFVWAKSMGAGSTDEGNCLTADRYGNIYATGTFQGTTDFDPGAQTFNLTSAGSTDVFVLKLSCDGVLPVLWMNFEAEKNKHIQLNWQTASEVNNSHFEIERNIRHPWLAEVWQTIGKVQGNGTTNSVHSYQFTDTTAALIMTKTLYYRLKQTDFDGRFNYSEIKTVNFDKEIRQIQIYPNPSNSSITIQTNGVSENSTYTIADEAGLVVINGSISSTSTFVDITRLSAGFYFIRIDGFNGKIFKLIKQ